jgi:hypothetical protein
MINKSLKKKVLDVLSRYPEARDNDVKLCNALWYEYYNNFLRRNEDGDLYIRLKDMYEVPLQDDIIRLRRVIQNDEKKFQASELIKQERFKAEIISRAELGYPSAQLKYES